MTAPKWHIPSNEEVQFANELLALHFESALDDILKICQTKMHSDPGNISLFDFLGFEESCYPSFSAKCSNSWLLRMLHLLPLLPRYLAFVHYCV